MFSYGLEIEAVDFDRTKITLPKGCTWSKKEVTLVNSNGVAVDSTKNSKNHIGGEVNTKPTQTIDEQIKVALKCLNWLKLGGAKVNYRTNLHCHIGLPPEYQNVETLQQIQKHVYDNYDEMLMFTMGEGQFKKKPEYPLSFWSHYKERMVPEYKHKMLLEAKTLKEFQMTFFKAKNGNHAPMTFMRQGVNTHSFFKTKTIEFRIFWGTLDIREIETCLRFADFYLRNIIGSDNPKPFSHYKKFVDKRFPKELPFSLQLERGFQNTKVAKP